MANRSRRWNGPKIGDIDSSGLLRNLHKTLLQKQEKTLSDDDFADPKIHVHRPATPFYDNERVAVVERPRKIRGGKKKKVQAQEIIRVPRDQREAITTILVSTRPEVRKDGAFLQKAPLSDFGKSSFDKLSRLRTERLEFVADYRSDLEIDEADALTIARRIKIGAVSFDKIIDPESDGYVGYDFGTSSTKVAVRWPLVALTPGFAIAVPRSWRSGNSPHLWPTLVFYSPSQGGFSLVPRPGSIALSGFKAALIENLGHRMAGRASITNMDASVAFLAMHIAYVLGTISEKTKRKVSGINFALPVATLNQDGPKTSFDLALAAALRLVADAESITLEKVREALASCKEPIFFYRGHAELSGVIAGYCRSPRRHVGAHMIIDSGSATLDMAAFQLTGERWPVGISAAAVELLGADAMRAYCDKGAEWADCIEAARYEEHSVYAATMRRDKLAFMQNDRQRYPYQVILAGGGIEGLKMKEMLSTWQTAFERPFVTPELDETLEIEPDTSPGRLIIADGLAWDPDDLRKVLLPSSGDTRLGINTGHDWTSN